MLALGISIVKIIVRFAGMTLALPPKTDPGSKLAHGKTCAKQGGHGSPKP